MTTYPLPTLACTIGPAGITAPSYADIYASLQASFKSIYGSDAYIDPDSQDGQMLAVYAKAQNETNNVCIAVYNSFSPASAQGEALSSNVKINGLRRLVPSNSQVDVTLTGTAGTAITNGIVQDVNGNQWLLPQTVTIGNSGSVTATASAAGSGAITAAAGAVNSIATPTIGWQTVTNPSAAVAGAPVESDALLRVRQSVSTSLPASSIVDAIYAALANLPGVLQLRIFENDLKTPDANGLPGNSIAVVIQGGDATSIAQTIQLKKTPGTYTYGTTSIIVQDTKGLPLPIRFFIPTPVPITVNIALKALNGYVSTTGAQIASNILAYINGLGINANNGLLALSALYEPAYDAPSPKTFNVTGITLARDGNAPAAADLLIAFNELPVITAANIVLTVS